MSFANEPSASKKLAESFTLSPQPETLYKPIKEGGLYIGVPKETSFQERRVALTPSSVSLLVNNGHRVTVESDAGLNAHFKDIEYSEAGARIVKDVKQVFDADMIIKVAPPTMHEIGMMKMHQTVLSPLHLPMITEEYINAMTKKKVTALAYEYLKDEAGYFPIVRILSEIAGSSAVLIAAQCLSLDFQGKGILLGGISNLPPSKVVILGAGVVGEYVARSAIGLGADVRVFDNNLYKLMRLQNNLGRRVYTSSIIPEILSKELADAEVVVGAIHSESGSAPCVVSEAMVSQMKKGSVIIDISIDQGGCFETSEITSHNKPTFIKHDVIHYCVPNIAARVPQTASKAFSNVLTSLLLKVNDYAGNFDKLLHHRAGIRNGIYIYKGVLTNKFLANRFDLKHTNLDLFMTTDF